MKWTLTTPPAVPPITLAEAKDQLRLEWGDTEEDDYLDFLITSAWQMAERFLGRSLITQTITAHLDEWPADELIRLPGSPVQSITEIKYWDADSTEQTLNAAAYEDDVSSTPARIRPIYGTNWPALAVRWNAVSIEYKAGYGDAPADVPYPIRQAMRILIGDLYENRESVVVGTNVMEIQSVAVKALLGPDRIQWSFG